MAEAPTTRPQLSLWERLTPEHQAMVSELIQSLAAIDSQLTNHQPSQNTDALTLLKTWRAEVDAMTPKEAAAADADWADLQAALNANRAPEPPLFP